MSFFQRFSNIFQKTRSALTAIIITISAALFFLSIVNPVNFLFFQPLRLNTIIISAFIFIFAYLMAFLSPFSFFKTISIWLQTIVLIFYSFSYILTIENWNFLVLASGFLTLLIFVNTWQLYTFAQNRFYLVMLQTFLFFLQTFSFLEFTQTDNTKARQITDIVVSNLFKLDFSIWIIICAMSVTLISIFLYQKGRFEFTINGFSYWQKSLFMLIIWDFLLFRLWPISEDYYDSKYWSKTYLSAVYHGLLLIAVIFATTLTFS